MGFSIFKADQTQMIPNQASQNSWVVWHKQHGLENAGHKVVLHFCQPLKQACQTRNVT